MVEHADFLCEAERMIERKQVDQWSEVKPLRALRDRGQKDARRGRHAERGRVMLGQVVRVKSRLVGSREHIEPARIGLAEGLILAALDVIEDSERDFVHGRASGGVSSLVRRSWSEASFVSPFSPAFLHD
jgi:hypothetical protein